MLATPATPVHPKRVLVVDDNETSALTLTWAMELFGYDVRTCYNGHSAVEVAHEFQPEVVLLDIGMPIMDGYEVCRQLRNDKALCGTRIVAQTGWGDPESRRRSNEAGFDLHLTKPLNLSEVKQVIEEAV